jgi:hypothetical protein
MLTVQGIAAHDSHAFSRRQFLRIGSFGGILTLADQLRAKADLRKAGISANIKSAVLIDLEGGPSQLDTYDLKPHAPTEIRGEFRPIRTNVVGIEICEHFALQARIFDKLALIRSVVSAETEHSDSIVMTGYPAAARRTGGHPAFGSVISKMRGVRGDVPSFVSLRGETEGTSPGILGSAHKPFSPTGPDRLNLRLGRGVAANRLTRRKELLQKFESLNHFADASGSTAQADRFNQQAIEMILSGKVRRALDLSMEDVDTLKRFVGIEQVLQTIRLIEAGVGCVTLGIGAWDTHTDNFRTLKSVMPIADRAIAYLIEGLHERGLADDVIVIALGEFGRTPRINKAAGRDHWSSTMSVLVAGGGLQMGQVIGSTNRYAEYPATTAVSVAQVLASVYRAIGVDPATAFLNSNGRPIPILEDRDLIQELCI